MSWLERLKNLEAAETVLPELTEAPSVSFVSAVLAPVEDCAPPSVSFVSAESGDADFSADSPEPVPAAAVDNRPAVDNFGAVDNSAPTGHCPACGSPSFWRSPSSPGWRCAYCEPRPQPLPAGAESLTLAGGQWAPGCAPPADPGDDPPEPHAPRPPRPDDGRVQDAYSAWRSPINENHGGGEVSVTRYGSNGLMNIGYDFIGCGYGDGRQKFETAAAGADSYFELPF